MSVYPTHEPGDELPNELPGARRGTPIDELLPRMRGWIRLNQILHAAAREPDIMASDGASEFVTVAIALTARLDALKSASVRQALVPLRRLYEEQAQSDAAEKRNQRFRAAEAWVRGEWQLHREGYGGNKSAFARNYVSLVMQEFGPESKVTEETIRRRWLSGV